MFEVKINCKKFKAGTFTKAKEKFINEGAKMSRSNKFVVQGFIYNSADRKQAEKYISSWNSLESRKTFYDTYIVRDKKFSADVDICRYDCLFYVNAYYVRE
ncbi:MAG: hypothetical protein NC340_02275 [Ruminococcus flavefaciens]|nr:hypothetical protein [Ruminococcus flavefaciens]MCM1229300.1 hypothetical protein [Ruminococcus flavefaciens]